MNRTYLYILIGVQVLILNAMVLGQSGSTPTPQINTNNKYFPESLICNDVISGDGPTVGRIIIGATLINDLMDIYEDIFEVRVTYYESLDTTLIGFYDLMDSNIISRLEACVDDDGIIVALKGSPPEPLSETDNLPTPLPGFRLVGLSDLVYKYGEPEAVTYSFSPYHRIVFWFSEGVAAKIYVNKAEPSAFGSMSQSETVYFAYQDSNDYMQSWPYVYTYPEWILVGDDNVPSDRNPFDFEDILATQHDESEKP